MTVSSTTRQAGPYDGNDVTTAFPFAFRVFSAGDVQVVQTDPDGVETTLTLTTHYTVSLNANQNSNPGGTVTAVSAPATGYKWTLTSDIDPLQAIDLTNLGGFYPAVINTGFDKLTVLIQQLLNAVGRAIKVPISDNTGEITIPTATVRANTFLAFDGAGLPIAASGMASAPVSTYMATVVAATTAANARALLGFDSSSGGDFLVFQNTAAGAEAAVRVNVTQTTSGASVKLSNSGLNTQAALRGRGDGGFTAYVGQTAGAGSTSGVQAFDIGPTGNVTVGLSTRAGERSLAITNTDASAAAYSRLNVTTDAGAAFLQVASIAGGRAVTLYSNTGSAFSIFTQDSQQLRLGTNSNANRMVFGATGGITVNEVMTFSGSTNVPVAKNTAKAWVNFDASSGTPAIQDSYNVTSITDNGIGDYTLNFTTAMANANYAAVGTARGPGATQSRVVLEQHDSPLRSTTQLRIYTLTASWTVGDSAVVSVVVFGS